MKTARAARTSLFGRQYEVTVRNRTVGTFRAMSPAGHGRIRLGDTVWSARREGLFRGAWNLFGPDDEHPVMSAHRPSAFRNSVVVTTDDTEWEIHVGSFGNRLTLTDGDRVLGRGRTTWSSRNVEMEVPDRWPDLWAAFSLWLAVWLSRRRGAAAVASGR